jgi:hypothetical protein
MVPRLFANVPKLLQVGAFFLLSHRVCSPLFVRVGVLIGVFGVPSVTSVMRRRRNSVVLALMPQTQYGLRPSSSGRVLM